MDTLLVNGDAHDAHEGGKQSTVQEIWCQVLMLWRRRRRRRSLFVFSGYYRGTQGARCALLTRVFTTSTQVFPLAPSPTPSPTDPVPAGPRTAGRLRTRHLARKVGILDAQNTLGLHTPSCPPFFACVILPPRSGGLGRQENDRRMYFTKTQ